ncbi:peptidoglycan-binding protein [Bradyrhizobium diazoefficiens]|uniref:peptidoglycan-binding protein n=1 Tax=Bradyrhizobium diazoefficiens TaxID=1355477 RepID=UPI000BE79869|nr:peptidoglycan-binding protein [Bradyrhizobium diazoefficiens]PDT58730.1 non-ribosomal peptide synthase [Bradyrhizobium diazoefficiens]QLD43828.1 peptidoglycan-binding protein [Bradyrhizobium diazoefficiens]
MLDLHGISHASFDLVVASEVTSQAVYERKYRHVLEYPGEESGPTGGIGYDFGTQTRAQIKVDWGDKVDAGMLRILLGASGKRGDAAASYSRATRGQIDIPWDVALDVFCNHDLPRYLAILERYCPGAGALGPDCKGVLFSIAFNRDAAGFVKGAPRYAEMREIRACVASGDLARIPGLIRSMQRLWPKTSGLYARRETEARLFEKGLATHHPDEHARLEAMPPAPDPDLVVQVQTRLRELGYYDTGAVDGQLVPKGRTEAAILAFRHEHDLPLKPGIDDDLLAAMARAEPRQVSEIRASATTQDLREQGVQTIAITDQIKGWAGKLFGGSSVLGGGGVLAWLTDKATAVSSARDAVGGLGIPPAAIAWLLAGVVVLAIVAGLGVLIWVVAHKIEIKRVADYRTGKNT